jgi:hypothetical protein
MKTILVFKAPDIFMRDIVTARLEKEGIPTFGADSSVNVIYPNTPNLYFSGASAVIEGYRILVPEEDFERAKQIIQEIEVDIKNGTMAIEQGAVETFTALESASVHGDLRRFYYSSLFCIFVPVLPAIFAIYYFVKALKSKKDFSFIKVGVSLLLVFGNIFICLMIGLDLNIQFI